MNFLAIIVAAGLINFQQPLENNPSPNGNNKQLTELAVDYLKFRYSDAEFIQATDVISPGGLHHHVYVVFSSKTTSIDHCIIHISNDQPSPQIEHFSCMDYNTRLGFKENVHPIIKN